MPTLSDPTATLILQIAKIGKEHPSHPDLRFIDPFAGIVLADGNLDINHLDDLDGAITRRELLARFLLLSAVLDQGPDMVGLRQWVQRITNDLYRQQIDFLHNPIRFFEKLRVGIDKLLEQHECVKKLRAEDWARSNRTNPNRYNLFMDNARQALGYAVFRWGVPLALIHLLHQDRGDSTTPLLDHLETYPSTEKMTQKIKDDPRYGLGKAIGDKGAHLFGKWLVSSFSLIRRQEESWQGLSYEVPFDSNAGRVLWRTGYLLKWATEDDYIHHKTPVLQKGRGKGGKNYLRVTNIRGMSLSRISNLPSEICEVYTEICTTYLKTHTKAPQKIEIQRIQHAYLLLHNKENPASPLSAGDFDDGLIFIGTHYCFNHDKPQCPECPISNHCEGYQKRQDLITEYRT